MGFFGGDTGPLKAAVANANNAATQYGTNASAIGSSLTPFYMGELRAEHSLNPAQTDELLTAAEAPAGAAFANAGADLTRQAARTGNATTLTKDLDQLARERAKSAAGASEGIASEDVIGANQLKQSGAAGLQGLYGLDTKSQLEAMGQGLQGAEKIAAQPGMFGQIMGALGQGASLATGLGSMGAFGGGVVNNMAKANG